MIDKNLPTVDSETLVEVIKNHLKIRRENNMKQDDAFLALMRNMVVHTVDGNVFVNKFNSDTVEHGELTFGEKKITSKILSTNNNATGKQRMYKFASALGLGSLIHVPLYHSCMWVTIIPPKQSSILNLVNDINTHIVELASQTSTFIYSNYSFAVQQKVVEFILRHIENSTLNVKKDELLNYIDLNDLNILINGILTSIYPNGVTLTRYCVNNAKVDSKTGNRLCDFKISGNVDTRQLVFTDLNAIDEDGKALMSRRTPNSVSLEEVTQYRNKLKEKVTKADFTIKSSNGEEIVFKLKPVTLKEYFEKGQKWLDYLMSLVTDSFTETTTDSEKNDLMSLMSVSMYLNIYSSYVELVKHNDDIYSSFEDVTGVLELLSSESKSIAGDIFNRILAFIEDSTISIIATPSYTCPQCGEKQNNSENSFKDLIPLNVIQYFFEIGVRSES